MSAPDDGREIRSPSRQSQLALDATAFCLADVMDGLGPFLVIYLTSQRHWTSGQAGAALSAMLLGTVLSQTLVGAWIDRTRHKRLAISLGSLGVALSCLLLYLVPERSAIYAVQFLTGVAVTIFPTALAAISLGMAGRAGLPARAGRNEACFHAGNVAAAGLAGALNWSLGNAGAFLAGGLTALGSALAVLGIREADIDHALARGADAPEGTCYILPIRQLLADRRVSGFMAATVLFHFANAAMLPLVGQKVAAQMPERSAVVMAACIIVAQLTMVPVALAACRGCARGRKPIMLIAFAVLPVRGLLYTITANPAWLIANQILDGVGAGIFGVASVLIMADLTQGTGRFNFAQGLSWTGISLGAALSNALTGLIVDATGFDAGFGFLSLIAVCALLLFAGVVPETAPHAAIWGSSAVPAVETPHPVD
jgi:MFS family permease